MSANNQTHIPVVWKTLAELGEIIGGRGLTKAELLKTGSIGCIHYGQIYTTYEISTTKTISFCTEETAEKCIKVFPGDIIFTKVGENKEDICKPVVWLGKKPIYTGAGAVVIRPKPECNPLYIAYYSQAQAFRLMVKHGATSTTVTNMSISSLKNINIPLPPPEKQQKLATFLDEAFALIDDLIDNAQRHLELAKKLFSEILRETLSDQSGLTTFQLGEQVTFIDYRGKTPPKTTTGIRLITAKNVKMGFIQHTPEEFIEASIYDQWMTRGYPKNGDVLFTTEAPLGNVAQLYTDEKVVIGQRLITMKPNPEFLLPNFLKWLLMSDPVQRQIHSLATGATVQGIKARLLKTIQLAAPNIEKQKQLDAKLEQAWQITRELEQQYQEKLNTVKHLKTALLAKVFHETPLTAPPHSTPDKKSIPKDHTPKETTA